MSDAEKSLVEKLKSTNANEVNDALVKIRKSYVRNRCKMRQLQKYSVIKLMIPLLEHPKFCSLSLSIIADGCLEYSFVEEVVKCNGAGSIVRIMKSFVNDDIRRRACRALGNISKFDIGFKAIQVMKPISHIIRFLSESIDPLYQQTAVRTLMIMGKNPKVRDIITQENGIACIAKLLHSSNVNLLICSIRAIADLTQNCNLSCAQQLLELGYFRCIVELHSHTEIAVRNNALISLKNLSSHECIRSSLVKVGAIRIFAKVLSSCESHEMIRSAALALCSCLDHMHMWSHNGTEKADGLKALLVVLQDEKLQDIHLRVIAALIPLAYESKISYILLDLDVLQVLIKILELFVKKHRCKEFHNLSVRHPFEKYPEVDWDVEGFHPELQLDISSNMHSKHILEDNSEIMASKSLNDDNFVKAKYFSHKTVIKWERSMYSFRPVTSDYSSSCSPTRICSPTQKSSISPDINYERDYGSSCSGVWSPVSHESENLHNNITCLSPVLSTPSYFSTASREEDENFLNNVTCGSPVESPPLSNFFGPEKQEGENIHNNVTCCSPVIPTFPDATDLLTFTFDEYNSMQSTVQSSSQMKQVSELKNKRNFDEISDLNPDLQVSRKKLKMENINQVATSNPQSENSGKVKVPNSDAKDISSGKLLPVSKQISHYPKVQRIDHYILLFIWQLSFHLGTQTNSKLADKSCFSVIIEYLCLIHNFSPKAFRVLSCLVTNRYCFEKLIVNGFMFELEEKMELKFSCNHHSHIRFMYADLITKARQEAESDFGVGTLSHILVTSEELGKLNAICAMSRLVSEKSALYRILFEANGLSLLLSFLSHENVITRRRIVVSLCEVYQSLTKEQKEEKCCFVGTCSMKTSSKCFYRESYLDVTFAVRSGGKILANREKICANSEYFDALLNGPFLESKAEVISLPDISAENLSTIFHFLHGCGTGRCCPYIKRIPFSVCLELLSDCDKFLLGNIKVFVEDRLCHRIYPSTIPRIYMRSKIHNSPALFKRTLHAALSLSTSQKDVLCNCFEELINLESNFISDVESLIRNLF